MAINVSFNGATIYKPGAYSKTTIDLGGGFPLGATGIVAIIGEADRGTPGDQEADSSNNVYSPEQLSLIRQKYGPGPIADAAAFAFAPASDAAIPSGAQFLYIYKTNSSTQASRTLPSGLGTLKALEWGTGGNRISVENQLTSEVAPKVTSANPLSAQTAATLSGKTLQLRKNGSSEIIAHTFQSNATIEDAVDELNMTLSSEGLEARVLTPGQDTYVVIALEDAEATAHRDGWQRSLEVISTSASTALGLGAQLARPVADHMSAMKIVNSRDLLTEEHTFGGNAVLMVGFSGSAAGEATVTVTSSSVQLIGPTQEHTHEFSKSEFATIGELVSQINTLQSGDGKWRASVASNLYSGLPISMLDQVSDVGARSSDAEAMKPAIVKKDAAEFAQAMAESSQVSLAAESKVGLPDAMLKSSLTGGTKGGTTDADIVEALAELERVRVNFVVPLFSRDADKDVADELTDPSSTYTIDAIHQAVKTHLSLMATTKRRSERQAAISLKDTYEKCKDKAANLADARIQLVVQDVRQIDSRGSIKWFQPWALATLVTGARAGSPVGTPMTFKFMNCSGIRQTAQSMSTAEENIVMGFDPSTQYDDAIRSGVTFLENAPTGGFRLVVDNTTYGLDGNWVLNRANVLYAADVVAYDFRNQVEALYVGKKNTILASEISSTCDSILRTYVSQGITVGTSDAPNGYKDLSVSVEGNTITIGMTVKLVEGIDFVLADITVQRASST